MIRFFAYFMVLWLSGGAFAAEPILVPDVTPATTAEFGVARQMHQAMVQGLKEKGYMVLTSQTVRPIVGGQIDGCFEEQTCPYGPLQHLPARLALVTRVVRDVDRLLVQVAVYDGSTIQPIDTHELQVSDVNEAGVVATMIQMVEEAAEDLAPAPDSLWKDAAELVTKSTMENKTGLEEEPKKNTTEVIVNINPNVSGTAAEGPTPGASKVPAPRQASYSARHLLGVKKAYERSGMELRGWMLRRSPHSGRFLVEIRGGVGIGDVDRHADVHVTITDEANVGWYQEGPAHGARVRGGLYLGYAPTAAFDFGVLAGLQYGFKTLVSGWTDTAVGDDRFGADTAQAVQFYIQPRARVYMVWTGPVKPYALAGFETRIFDSLKIRDTSVVDYPDPSGGVFFGPMGGLGVMIDPGPAVGFFVEGSFTYHMGLRSAYAQNDPSMRPETIYEPTNFDQYTIGVVGGVQFRL